MHFIYSNATLINIFYQYYLLDIVYVNMKLVDTLIELKKRESYK